jgi:3-methyladenine DNA glycosylase Mpg
MYEFKIVIFRPSRNLKARKSKIVNVNEEESSESQDDAAESILSKTTKTKCMMGYPNTKYLYFRQTKKSG